MKTVSARKVREMLACAALGALLALIPFAACEREDNLSTSTSTSTSTSAEISLSAFTAPIGTWEPEQRNGAAPACSVAGLTVPCSVALALAPVLPRVGGPEEDSADFRCDIHGNRVCGPVFAS